jgi:orotidine-5'-phosphate decarboxylase
MTASPPVFCALDTTAISAATDLAGRIGGAVGGLKLGLEFFTAAGPDGVRAVQALGMPVFLDLKLHDIPNTVAGAMRSVAALAPLVTTIHAAGGRAMIEAAARAAEDGAAKAGKTRTKVVAVTVLTSLDDAALAETGVDSAMTDQVRRLAGLAQQAGADGVVCSPHEVAALRAQCGPGFLLVVPGIRPDWAAANDQKRFTTPSQAIAAGADWLVIGRPITDAPDPKAAALRIAAELGAG